MTFNDLVAYVERAQPMLASELRDAPITIERDGEQQPIAGVACSGQSLVFYL